MAENREDKCKCGGQCEVCHCEGELAEVNPDEFHMWKDKMWAYVEERATVKLDDFFADFGSVFQEDKQDMWAYFQRKEQEKTALCKERMRLAEEFLDNPENNIPEELKVLLRVALPIELFFRIVAPCINLQTGLVFPQSK